MLNRTYAGLFGLILFHLLTICLLNAQQQKNDISLQRIVAGVFTFEVPIDWEVLSGSEELQARKETEGAVKQMIDRYESDSNFEKGYLGIQSFKAIRMPKRAGWYIAYTVRIPPQQDYLATMEKEQKQKLSWGKQQGIVTRVVHHGRSNIGGADVLRVDAEMRQGARSIGIYYWSAAEKGAVGTITVIVNPGYYNDIKPTLDKVITSIRIKNPSDSK